MFGLDSVIMFFSVIINLILLIAFFVMGSNIGKIKSILIAWAKQEGYGMSYKCGNCKKIFVGHPDNCPHCNELTSWGTIKLEINKLKTKIEY